MIFCYKRIEKRLKVNKGLDERYTFTPVLKKSKPCMRDEEFDKQTKTYLDRVKAAQKEKQEKKEKLITKCIYTFI
jgi:hypothetical protein